MGYRIGSGYFGSNNKMISTNNQEIIQQHKPNNYNSNFQAYKFSFINYQDCHIKINGSNQIFLAANQGFEISEVDAPIRTFEIVESGIEFNYIGAY